MKKIAMIAMMLLPILGALAQNSGEIKGKVLDSLTAEPLGLATVYVEIGDQMVGTTTNFDGAFTLKPLPTGSYNLWISYVGYPKRCITGVKVSPDKITFMGDIAMTSKMITGVVITGYKEDLIIKDDPSRVTIKAAQIEAMPNNKNLVGILRNTNSDVFVKDDEIYFRGSRSGDAAFYVDGVRMGDQNMHIPGCAIGSMTVYSGGVPAKYGDFTGGVVVIETKSYFEWLNDQKAKGY